MKGPEGSDCIFFLIMNVGARKGSRDGYRIPAQPTEALTVRIRLSGIFDLCRRKDGDKADTAKYIFF